MLSQSVRLFFSALILVGAVAGFLVLASRAQPPARDDLGAKAAKGVLVETAPVERHTGILTLEVDGVVVPTREVEIHAEIAGRIVRKAEIVRAGNFITKGTTLFEIDDRDLDLEIRRLNKELEQSTVNLQELDVEVANLGALIQLAEEEVGLQRKELQRLLAANQDGGRVIADSQLDETRRKELAARNSLQTLRNQVALLQTRRRRWESAEDLVRVQLEKAMLDKSRTQITAPLDGMIVRDLAEQDAFVQRGEALVAMEDTSSVEVRCNLKMEELCWLWQRPPGDDTGIPANYQLPPAPVTIRYALGSNAYCWEGHLGRYDGIGLDEKTRTAPCRIVVPQPRTARVAGSTGPAGPPALVRGMFVTGSIRVESSQTLLQVPERAVRPGGVVWVARDGKLARVPIEVARRHDGQVLVWGDDAALREGDRVVVSPLTAPANGMAVRESAVLPKSPESQARQPDRPFGQQVSP